MRYDTKTGDELRTEIAYYETQLRRTTSLDRIRRMRAAVRVRRDALVIVEDRERAREQRLAR